MIGVTLFCIVVGGYVGSQWKIVVDRKAALADVTRTQGWFIIWTDGVRDNLKTRDKTISLVRRCLGEQPVYWLVYKHGATGDDIRRLQGLFPEALIDDDVEFGGVRARQP
jgi:hypothetical protein